MKIDENLDIAAGLNTMYNMISESGLLFWATLYGQSVSHLICLYTHRQHVFY